MQRSKNSALGAVFTYLGALIVRVKDDLSFKDVDELLSYNPGTGVLTWKVSRGRVSAGARAGSVTCYGYLSVRVMGSRYMAHRLAYLLYYEVWPDEAVDHFDRDRLNNKISNLRPCSWAENAMNVGHYKTNTSGLQGASYRNGRWRACMRALGVHMHLGVFNSPDEAHKAYVSAKRELHPFWNPNFSSH